MTIYVSQSKGHDSYDGTKEGPLATLHKAFEESGSGESTRHIVLLDTYDAKWEDHSFIKNASVQGNLDRFRSTSLENVSFHNCTLNGFIVDEFQRMNIGLSELRGPFRLGAVENQSSGLTVANCRRSYHKSSDAFIAGIDVQNVQGVTVDKFVAVGLSDSPDTVHPGRGYGLVCDERCRNVSVVNSLFAGCTTTGLWLKSGGSVEDSLFIDNQIGLQLGQGCDGNANRSPADFGKAVGCVFLGGLPPGSPFIVCQHSLAISVLQCSFTTLNFKQNNAEDRACIRVEDWVGRIQTVLAMDNYTTWDNELLTSKGPNNINYTTESNVRDIVHYDLGGLGLSRAITPGKYGRDAELRNLGNAIPKEVARHHEMLRGK